MKRMIHILLAVVLLLSSCGRPGTAGEENNTISAWQEQYDLGVRYLSEGNYEEAIIAFTAAIEIDPKQAPAYVGRGKAYVLSGETEENLNAAQVDYEHAIELDESNADAYLGLADVYIRRGDYDKALEILQQGMVKTGGNEKISDKIDEMEQGNISDSSGKVWRETVYDPDGNLNYVYDFTYDSRGFEISFLCTSYVEGESNYSAVVDEFDENGYPYRRNYYEEDGTLSSTYDIMKFNKAGQEIERYKYDTNGTDSRMSLFRFYYDEKGNVTKYEEYENGETLLYYAIYTYDENGNATGEIHYTAGGEIEATVSYD